MKRLLPLILLAPLFVGFAPRDSANTTVEFWGGTGRFYRPGGCEHTGRDVKFFEGAVSLEHRPMEEKEALDDSGRVVLKKIPTPFSIRFDGSMLQGATTEVFYTDYIDEYRLPATGNITVTQFGLKLQGDWQNFGLGLGGLVLNDDEEAGLAPSARVRVGRLDQLYLSGELLYANPMYSGHGLLSAGLGFRARDLDAWIGAGYGPYDDDYRPYITVKQHFDNIMVGLNASYATKTNHGITPYAVSIGVGFDF